MSGFDNNPQFFAPINGPFAPTATCATAATRYVGGTISGAPICGTWNVGDWVVTQDGNIYICTVAGTPGTWVIADTGAFAPIGGPFAPSITGAITATRYVGGTATVAPTTGTFNAGDFVISQNGKIWICTAGGSPGTWIEADSTAYAPIGGPFAPSITGATTATRYVGGTATVAPTTGTFNAGDFVISQNGKIWICTAGGSPGTWIEADSTAYAPIGGPFAPSITGATTATRFVGGTATVAPTTGTFNTGDFVISQNGKIWICTVGGSPGTWIEADSTAYAAIGGPFAPSLTGAVSATRYVGGTATVAPTTGTFAVGDFVISQNGKMWICTVAGTPGTWVEAGSADYAPIGGPFAPSLTGAVSATRYVGGTASVAPTTGTFAVGDFVIAQNGTIWICTSAGTPGTWIEASVDPGAWTGYTPGLTQAGVGVGATTTRGAYSRLGRTINATAVLTVTGTGTANGVIVTSVPVEPAAGQQIIGVGAIYDSSLNLLYKALVFWTGSTTGIKFLPTTTVNNDFLGSAVFIAALASGDTIGFQVAYEALS